jgi:dimethylargininase
MATFAAPARVLVRDVSDGYADCLREDRRAPIDVATARAQHARYVAIVRELGIEVETIVADSACADCAFVEDTAVIAGRNALLTCPGAPSRRAEVAPVGDALARTIAVHRMALPATLDGGDVLRAGMRLFVGLSSRTNRAGVDALARVAALEGVDVVAIEVRGGLHLKSACTLVSAQQLVFAAETMRDEDLAVFRAAGLDCVATDENAGANVLALGSVVLVSAAAPRTAAKLAASGVDVRTIDVGEFHKGDGALTCLSLRVAPPGSWCA